MCVCSVLLRRSCGLTGVKKEERGREAICLDSENWERGGERERERERIIGPKNYPTL